MNNSRATTPSTPNQPSQAARWKRNKSTNVNNEVNTTRNSDDPVTASSHRKGSERLAVTRTHRGFVPIAVMIIAALVSTIVFATPAYAQDETDLYQTASDDIAYTDVDEPVVLDLAANDAGPVDLAPDAADPAVLVIGMEFGTLTLGIDTDGNEAALYEPMPSFSGVDIGEYMVCWDTVCAGASVKIYVGTAACTISADNPDGPTTPGNAATDTNGPTADSDTSDANATNSDESADPGPSASTTTETSDTSDDSDPIAIDEDVTADEGPVPDENPADPTDDEPAATEAESATEDTADDDTVDLDVLFGDGPVEGVVLYGTDHDDVICGTNGPDTIFAGNGDDIIFGRGGQDELLGENGDDLIFGGSGIDTITGGNGEDTLHGHDGDDTINGGSDADTINGGPGDDTLSGDSQNDVIDGGPGDDTIDGGSDSDTLDGGEGVDVVDGSWQDDTCSNGETYVSCETTDEPASDPTGADASNELTCNGLAATIIGTPGDDVLQGDWQDDVIVGLGGNDTINGQSGADTICGGDGNDTIFGQSGTDHLQGGDGDDTITGESQNDNIHGGNGNDNINGGSGDDTLDGGNGVDVVDGLWDNDTCDDAETATNCETVTYNGESDTPTEPNQDPFSCNGLTATIVGTPGDDVLAGTWQDDVIVGLGGNDIINGQSGADTICGGDGDDIIDGAAQNDILFGGNGSDMIYGRSGQDIIDGGPGNDVITGDSQSDIITGGDGDDDINGGSDNDTLDGGPGIDTINGLWQNDTCSNGETYVSCETIEEPDPTDGDSDGDGTPDEDDAFPNDPNETTDTDGDGTGDNADLDDDGDGTPDEDDAFPLDPNETTDTDGDGLGDNADDDIDGDGTPNEQDAFPLDPAEDTDTDGDGVGDNADAFPNDPIETTDIDGDGVGDNADAFPEDPNETVDTDGDGVGDNSDAFPDDPNETADSDGDGVGDNTDAFPEDETETVDTDGDGVGDNTDAFPNDPTETADTDGDGTGNNEDEDDDNDGILDEDDAYPLNPDESGDADADGIGDNEDEDDDNDGTPDQEDAFPLDPTEQIDTDGDGVGDNADAFPEDSYEYVDSDGDGVGDKEDEFPEDPTETIDTDGDGVGDNADADDDGDGVNDVDDAFPLSALEVANADGDSLGDLFDLDDDNDLVLDEDDEFPFDPFEWIDTDGDGIGDNSDSDDDGDGVNDVDDADPLDDSLGQDQDFDLVDDAVDSDRDGDGVLNVDDVFPDDGRYAFDTDGDGVADGADADADGDGYGYFVDAFPQDAGEWLDTDGDGLGNNADADDDDDGVGDNVDAFPLNALESADSDGDGIGDNAELTADSDRDGTPDIADDDRDGDGVPNDSDAFPDDGKESRDQDGDGVGDRSDLDDDGDGIIDQVDQDLNFAAVISPDQDGDGVIDAYDNDPFNATDQRFAVAVEGAQSAVSIVSDDFISAAEVEMTILEPSAEDAFAAAHAGPIVDFEIAGETEFESARITVPYDPAVTPDPAIWWLDEATGLWLKQGVDTTFDVAARTVSTTVDHFSQYVAAAHNLVPQLVVPNEVSNALATAEAAQTATSDSVDVVVLVDVSGSTGFSYLDSGTLTAPSDPLASKRQFVVDELLDVLGAANSVALGSFASEVQLGPLGATPSSFDVSSIALRSGTNLEQAVGEAVNRLQAGNADTSKAIIVISDGVFDTVPEALPQDIAVHGVSISEAGDAAMAEIIPDGSVFVPSSLDDLPRLVERLLDAVGTTESDYDLIPASLEIAGVPTYGAISYAPLLGGTPRPPAWVSTDPTSNDTDGDLLWDSEELVAFDLRTSPLYTEQYSHVIDAGYPIIYQLRSNPLAPTGRLDPFNADGGIARSPWRAPDISDELRAQMKEYDDDVVAAELTALGQMPYSLEGAAEVRARLSASEYLRARSEDLRPVPNAVAGRMADWPLTTAGTTNWPNVRDETEAAIAQQKIESVFDSQLPQPGNQLTYLSYEEVDVLRTIQQIDIEIRTKLEEVLFPVLDVSIEGVDELALRRSELIDYLVARVPSVAPADRDAFLWDLNAIRSETDGELDYTGAFRLLKVRSFGNDAFNSWLLRLQAKLGWEVQNVEPGFATLTPFAANLSPEQFRQVELEIIIARRIQQDALIDATNSGDEFFDNINEFRAWKLLEQYFAFAAGDEPRIADSTFCRSNFTTLYPLVNGASFSSSPPPTADEVCQRTYNDQSVSLTEFLSFLDELEEIDSSLKTPQVVRSALIGMWDDISNARDRRSDWLEPFINRDLGPADWGNNRSLDEFFYELPRAPQGGNNDDLTVDGLKFDDMEFWPSVITSRDINITAAVREAHFNFGGDAETIDTMWDAPGPWNDNTRADGLISIEDLDDYQDLVDEYGETAMNRIRSIIDLKLYDDTFGVDDFAVLVELAAEVLATLATGGFAAVAPGLARAFYYIARGAQAAVVVVYLAEGEIVNALLTGAFLVLDVRFFDLAGRTALAAALAPQATIAQLSSSFATAVKSADQIGVNSAVTARVLKDMGEPDRALAIGARSSQSTASSEALHAAYLSAVIDPRLLAELPDVLTATQQAALPKAILDSIDEGVISRTALDSAVAFFDRGTDTAAALKAYEIAGDGAITLGDDFVQLVKTECFGLSEVCNQGLTGATLSDVLTNTSGIANRQNVLDSVIASRQVSEESAETFGKWAATNPTAASTLDPEFVRGAARAPTPGQFVDILDATKQTDVLQRSLDEAQMAWVARHPDLDEILPLLDKFNAPGANRDLDAKPAFVWNVLGQLGGRTQVGGEAVEIGVGNIPGYGPLQAIARFESGAQPIYYDTGSEVIQIGVQGNRIGVVVTPAANGGALAIKVGSDGRLRAMQMRAVEVIDSSGQTRFEFLEADFATATIDGQPVYVFPVDLAEDPNWRVFNSNPAEDSIANNRLRKHFADSVGEAPQKPSENSPNFDELDAQFQIDRQAYIEARVNESVNERVAVWLVDGKAGSNPVGFTWHHDTPTGQHLLVDMDVHRIGRITDTMPFGDGFGHHGGVKSHGREAKLVESVITFDPGGVL